MRQMLEVPFIMLVQLKCKVSDELFSIITQVVSVSVSVALFCNLTCRKEGRKLYNRGGEILHAANSFQAFERRVLHAPMRSRLGPVNGS